MTDSPDDDGSYELSGVYLRTDQMCGSQYPIFVRSTSPVRYMTFQDVFGGLWKIGPTDSCHGQYTANVKSAEITPPIGPWHVTYSDSLTLTVSCHP